MSNLVIEELVQAMSDHAEQYRDTDEHTLATMSYADAWWQGDLCVQKLNLPPEYRNIDEQHQIEGLTLDRKFVQVAHMCQVCDFYDEVIGVKNSHKLEAARKPRPLNASEIEQIQLVEGQGVGSKHVLHISRADYILPVQQGLVGWLIVNNNPFSVRHPVHGDVTIKETGLYCIRFQKRYAGKESDEAGMELRALD